MNGFRIKTTIYQVAVYLCEKKKMRIKFQNVKIKINLHLLQSSAEPILVQSLYYSAFHSSVYHHSNICTFFWNNFFFYVNVSTFLTLHNYPRYHCNWNETCLVANVSDNPFHVVLCNSGTYFSDIYYDAHHHDLFRDYDAFQATTSDYKCVLDQNYRNDFCYDDNGVYLYLYLYIQKFFMYKSINLHKNVERFTCLTVVPYTLDPVYMNLDYFHFDPKKGILEQKKKHEFLIATHKEIFLNWESWVTHKIKIQETS